MFCCYFKSPNYTVLLLFVQKRTQVNFFSNFSYFLKTPYLWDGSKFLPVNQSVLEASNQASGDGLHSGGENRLGDVEGAMRVSLTQSGLQEED